MMDVYLVMIKDVNRWVDSIWIRKEAATDRAAAVRLSTKECGAPGVNAWVVLARLEDGKLAKSKKGAANVLGIGSLSSHAPPPR